jgi:hypothetical protein
MYPRLQARLSYCKTTAAAKAAGTCHARTQSLPTDSRFSPACFHRFIVFGRRHRQSTGVPFFHEQARAARTRNWVCFAEKQKIEQNDVWLKRFQHASSDMYLRL